MELSQDFSSLFNSNSPGLSAAPQRAAAPSTPAAAAGLSQDFSSVFTSPQQSQAQPQSRPTSNRFNDAQLDSILTQENANALRPLVGAFMGQESSGGANAQTSVDNAHGAMQILPATFMQYAKAGEQLDDPNANVAVGTRILADYAKRYDGDPSKIAVAYFSGPGNVATSGPTPWKRDVADGNGVKVSQYVQGITSRLGGQTFAPAPQAPAQPAPQPVQQPPVWKDIVANPAFQKLTADQQKQTADAYFQKWIAPSTPADQLDTVKAEWDAKSAAAEQQAHPSTWQKIKNGVADLANSAADVLGQQPAGEIAQDGQIVPPPSGAQPVQPTAGVLGNGKNLPAPPGAPQMPFASPQMQQQVFNQFDAATPDQRQQLMQQPGLVGQLAQYRAAQYANNRNPLSSVIGGSAEDRTARLIAAGVAPDTAAAQAKQEAAAGTPTVTPNYMKSTDYDFDTAAAFRNASPLARGIAKGGIGIGQAVVGLGQFENDMAAGLFGTQAGDPVAASLSSAAKSLQGANAGIGEPANMLTRNFEGAVSGVVQLAPAMLGGAFVKGLQLAPLAQNALQMFGQAYSEGRAAGQDPMQATARAGMMGAFAVLGHAFGLDSKLESIRRAVAGDTTDAIAQSLWTATMRDLPSTQAMALGNFITDKLPGGVGLTPEAKFTDWLHQAGDMFVQTVMMNGMLGAGEIGGAPLARTLRGEMKPVFDESSGMILDKNGNTWSVTPSQTATALPSPGAPGTSANSPHPSQVAADNALREIGAIHGVDASGLIPEPTPVPQPAAPAAAAVDLQPGTPVVWRNADTDVPVIYRGVAPDRGADGRLYAQVDHNGTPSFVPLDELAPAAPGTQAPAPAEAQPAPVAGSFDPQQVTEFARQRLDALNAKQQGSRNTVVTPEGYEDVTTQGQALTPAEHAEWTVLTQHANDPAAIAKFYGLDGAAPAPAGEPPAPSAEQVAAAAHQAATSPKNDLPEPTQAQKEAGNYQKGHVEIHGLDVTIENPQGSTRSGTDADGVVWKSTMQDHYGYIRRTVGADEEQIDTFVGPNPASRKVFIVDQRDPATGKFDEHKVMLGYDSMAEADAAYHRNYEPGWNGRSAISELPIATFKEWLAGGDTRKPFAGPVSAATRSAGERPPVDEAPQWAGTYDNVSKDPSGSSLKGWREIGKNPDGNSVYETAGMRAVRSGDYVVKEVAHKPEDARTAEFRTTDEIERMRKPRVVKAPPEAPPPKTEREAKARKLEKANGTTEAQGRARDGEARQEESGAGRPVASAEGPAGGRSDDSAAATRATGDTGAGRPGDAAGTGRRVQPGAAGSGRDAVAWDVKPKSEQDAVTAARIALAHMIRAASTEREKRLYHELGGDVTKASQGDADALASVEKAARSIKYDSIKPQLDRVIAEASARAPAAVTEKTVTNKAGVRFVDTRGTAARFHGTSRKIDALSDEYALNGDNRNIYGQGFYTTDAADIAHGYMKKGRGGNGTLYSVEHEPVKLYNMESPITPEIHEILEGAMGDVPTDNAETGAPLKNLREIFDEYRAESKSEGLTRDDVQGVFDSVRDNLERMGYRGYEHEGGHNTGNDPHTVRIFWNPESDVRIKPADINDYLAREDEHATAEHLDLQDASTFVRDSSLSRIAEPDRTSALTTLRRLNARLEKGEITDAEFRLGAQNLLSKLENKRDGQLERNLYKERERGELYIRERLLRAVRQGDIEHSTAQFAQWLLDQNPAIADDLGISVRTPGVDMKGAAGLYNSISRVVSLFKGSTNVGTAVHEILHHTERMMPDDVRAGVYKAWSRAWQDAYKAATPEQKPLFGQMLAAALGSRKAWDEVAKGFSDGVLKYDEHYKLVNPSEYWAVEGARILNDRFDAQQTGWIARARQWLSELVQKAKDLFGLASDAPILRGLKDVLKGDGKFTTDAMMTEKAPAGARDLKTERTDNSDEAIADRMFRDITKPPTERGDDAWSNMTEFMGKTSDTKSSVKTFGTLEKLFASQVHKAIHDPHFGRVFDSMRRMMNTTGLISVRTAEHAPLVLPKSDNLRQSVKTLFAGKRQSQDMIGATRALLDGTLAGDSVISGKVWGDKDLADTYKLGEQGIKIYKQARAAIDASLDEVAAAEAWSFVNGFVPHDMRDQIINRPGLAQSLIRGSIDAKIDMLRKAHDRAVEHGDTQKAEILHSLMMPYVETRKKVDDIFDKAEMLKSGGYVPLMRFGKYSLTAYKIDPETGMTARDINDRAIVHHFGLYPTEAEAKFNHERLAALYADDPTVRIERGVKSQNAHQLYEGLSPETLSLFADKVGADEAMQQVIQLALSERSALKRRLERGGIAGYSEDLPRILSNFLTSNGRFASQRYYMRDVNRAIQEIPQEKGDVMDEAIKLKQFVTNGEDPGSRTMAGMFLWTMAGSPVSAAVIASEPFQKIFPYLSQYGVTRAGAAIAKAVPYAIGRKQVKDPELRAALQRAGREGIIRPQEIFHLYDLGMQNMSTWLSSQLAARAGAAGVAKSTADAIRTRAAAFSSILGMMHSAAETFGRKMAFHAAWEVAKARGEKDPYEWTVRAIDEAGSQFGKINRSNIERTYAGRMLMAYKQFTIGWLGLLFRMARKGGVEGARGVLVMLLSQLAMGGLQGMPFMQNLDDLVDTVGNWLGHNTDFARVKRQWAEKSFGKMTGDVFLHGFTRMLPIDLSEHFGMGNIIPGTGILKASEQKDKARNILDTMGPETQFITRPMDAIDAASAGNYGKAVLSFAPNFIKRPLQGTQMLATGKSTDLQGRKIADASTWDGIAKIAGGASPHTNEQAEIRGEVRQAVATVQDKQAQITNLWARGISENNIADVTRARAELADWNENNPESRIVITPQALMGQIKQMRLDANTRAILSAPKGLKADAVSTLRGSAE
ncbi:PLxRFG domain-containing protein [Burkholderia sp. Bp8990]|uniref:PLxRFG domain-containing protein n=1 Tax=Burkholderia sp. Bp8990 TaxID=2184552 RepID=UPI000F5A1AB1|nr:PLxRFG domain-containing protein [Burkholderia sp. Bp8990]RQS39787.1 PLxRFG domain-containing protein [Burkholderia sp. Bp8990]